MILYGSENVKKVLHNFWLTNFSLLFAADVSGISLKIGKINCKKLRKINQSKVFQRLKLSGMKFYIESWFWKSQFGDFLSFWTLTTSKIERNVILDNLWPKYTFSWLCSKREVMLTWGLRFQQMIQGLCYAMTDRSRLV
jgi:hypothetical protein